MLSYAQVVSQSTEVPHTVVVPIVTKIVDSPEPTEILKTVYSQAVLLGREMPCRNFPESYPVQKTISETPPTQHEGHCSIGPNFEEFFVEVKTGKSNELFTKAWETLKNVIPKGIKQKVFFEILLRSSVFSTLGREDLTFHFSESPTVVEINLSFTEPFTAGDTNVTYQNKKLVNTILNKATNIIIKTEITNKHAISIYIWNYDTGEMVFTQNARIGFNHQLQKFFTHSVNNVFYGPENYPIMEQVVSSHKDSKYVKELYYISPEKK